MSKEEKIQRKAVNKITKVLKGKTFENCDGKTVTFSLNKRTGDVLITYQNEEDGYAGSTIIPHDVLLLLHLESFRLGHRRGIEDANCNFLS